METDIELIKLPMSLGLTINSILKEKIGFKPRQNKMGILSCEFTSEELALIDKLNFENPVQGNLDGIELLPNLKSLTIKSKGNTAYTQDKYIASISDKDVVYIAKCKSLEYLDVENQAKISYLDVSKMKNLHFLSLKRNTQLEDLFGLDKLEQIWQLDCFGNESLTQIEGLNSAIMQNKELSDLNLDLLLYPDAIGYDIKTGQANEETIKRFEEINVSWQEVLSSGKNIKINNYQMMNMHRTACGALEEYTPKYGDKRTMVMGIEQYLAENVVYDKQSLKSGHSHVYAGNDKLLSIVSGPIGGANGAYNAFMYKTSVCEGYTRAMQYLLRLKGIKSHNVHCISGKDNLHMSSDKGDDIYKTYQLPDDGYHSIVSIDDIDYLYDDPCWNAGRYQRGDKSMPWTLLTKDEISQDHTLSFNERNINNNTMNVPRKEIQIAMQRVATYREERRTKSKGKFSEQEIGKSTVNTPTKDKEDAQNRINRDELSRDEKNEIDM